MTPRYLILETSHQPGVVALADDRAILGQHILDEARRHARDLVPAAKRLLEEHACQPRELAAVFVSIGPGSYTGLRVGVMSAKMLAYATGCALIGIETFAAIARQAPAEADHLAVIADAQQGKIYVQHFSQSDDGWSATDSLTIRPFAEWTPPSWVSGPGLDMFMKHLPPSQKIAPRADWTPRAESLRSIGVATLRAGRRDDPFTLEPLYLRPSSAEENWKKRSV